MRILLAAVLLVACGKSKQDQAETAKNDFIVKSVSGDLEKVHAALKAGKPDDGQFKCAGALAGMPDLKASGDHAELVKDLDDTCNHDIHLAFLKQAAEKAEAARKAKPDEKVLSECYSAEHDMAIDSLKKAKREDDAAKELEARFAAACPKTK